MADGDGICRPVIASSSRYKDVLPYCKILLEEEPKRWGGIMPHQFPQHAGKDEEEAFLLTQFPASECQVQGFRFLKHVWYSIAINNRETRLPYMVNEWFVHKSKEYVDDPNFEVHLLSEEARASTFFEQAEIDLYGSDFLDWTVQGIQWRLRNPQAFAPQSASTPEAASVLEASDPPRQTSPVEAAEVDSASSPAQPTEEPTSSEQITAPISTAPSKNLSATAATFSSTNTPVQATATVFKPSDDAREYVANGKDFQSRTQRGSKRAPNGKRRGQGDRNVYQPATPFYDPRPPPPPQHAPVPMPPRPTHAIPGHVGPMPQFAAPGPSTYNPNDMRLPFAPSQPPPPRIIGPHPPHGFEHHPHQPMPMGGHGKFMQGHPPPQSFGYPPLSERDMNHGDARAFPPQPTYGGFDQLPDQGRGKGRDSAASYSGRGGGNGGIRGRHRGRGRGSISRSSADGDYHAASRHPSHGFNETSSFYKPYEDRATSNFQRAVDSTGSWRLQQQNENIAPDQRPPEQFSEGPPRILTRRTSHATATSGSLQYPNQRVSSTVNNASSHAQADNTAASSKEADPDFNEYHCSRTVIGDKCIYAHKLIAFSIPNNMSDDRILECFTRFGPVEKISSRVATQNNGSSGVGHRFITFFTHHGARECVKQRRVEIIPGLFTDVEVAKELWDPTHIKFQTRTPMGVAVQEIAPAPRSMHYVQKSAINAAQPLPVSFGQHEGSATAPAMLSKEEMPVEATLVASSSDTPNRKKKTGKRNKKKASDIRGEPIEQAHGEITQKGRVGLGPFQDDASSNAESVVTAVDTKHTKPVIRNDSLGNTMAVAPTQKDHRADAAPSAHRDDGELLTPTKTTIKVNRLATTEHYPLAEASRASEEAQVQAPGSHAVSSKSSNASSKSEDEHVDDSFHTASATPGGERNVANDEEAAQLKVPSIPPPTGTSLTAVQEVNGGFSATRTKHEAPIQPLKEEEEEKGQVLDLPKNKSKTSVAVPKLDTAQAGSDKDANGDEKQSATTQGVKSGSSGAPTAPFVTAPNTPASPILDKGTEPQVQSKKEGKATAKEEPKVKGPAQTESLSLFGKQQKKTKKPKAPKGNSRASSRITSAELPKPEEPPFSKATDSAKPAPIFEQPEAVEDKEEVSADGSDPRVDAVNAASAQTEEISGKTPIVTEDIEIDVPNPATAATATMAPEKTIAPEKDAVLETSTAPEDTTVPETINAPKDTTVSENIVGPQIAPEPEMNSREPGLALMGSAPSPAKTGILRRITGIFVGNSESSPSAGPSGPRGLGISSEPGVEAAPKADEVPDTLGDGDSPDAAGPSEATASKPSKKSKKKKSKKKATAVTDTSNAASTDANAASTDANAAQPNTIQPEATKPNTSRLIADVLEMSHPHPGNEVGKPLFAFTGTKGSAGTGASSSDKAKSGSEYPKPWAGSATESLYPK